MTGNLARRVHSLEATNKDPQQTMTFIWRGPQDDVALRTAQAEAQRTDRLLVIVGKFFEGNPGQQEPRA